MGKIKDAITKSLSQSVTFIHQKSPPGSTGQPIGEEIDQTDRYISQTPINHSNKA